MHPPRNQKCSTPELTEGLALALHIRPSLPATEFAAERRPVGPSLSRTAGHSAAPPLVTKEIVGDAGAELGGGSQLYSGPDDVDVGINVGNSLATLPRSQGRPRRSAACTSLLQRGSSPYLIERESTHG